LVLIKLLEKEEYQKALVFDLLSNIGMTRENKENVRRVHKMLLATIYPEIEKYEKERDDGIQQLLAEEGQKTYTFSLGGNTKPLSEGQIDMIGK
jgi:hypothetical protein